MYFLEIILTYKIKYIFLDQLWEDGIFTNIILL